MNMTEVKTADLAGAALDWAAAKAVEQKIDDSRGDELRIDIAPGFQSPWMPSANWHQGGPLIDKHVHLISQNGKGGHYAQCVIQPTFEFGEGDTILIAACRAIVSAKLGDVVSVPSELVEVGK